MPVKKPLNVILETLRSGPRFPWEIPVPRNARDDLSRWWRRGQLARTSRKHVTPVTRAYAYCLPEHAGHLQWQHQGELYRDEFQVSPRYRQPDIALPTLIDLRGQEPSTQAPILEALKDGPVFSDEVLIKIRGRRPEVTFQAVKVSLSKMQHRGLVVKWDEAHGGHRFGSGYLWGLPGCNFKERLQHLDPRLITPQERTFITQVQGAVHMLQDLKQRHGWNDDWVTFWLRKLARQAPIRVKAEGKGYAYHIEVEEDPGIPPEGKGLVPWLRWVNLFGSLVVFDEEHVDRQRLYTFLKKEGYWISQEGRLRNLKGQVWEAMTDEFFKTCDRHQAWQLRVVEERHHWKSPRGREFDHIYVCQLGPQELNLVVALVFECKSSLIRTSELLRFMESLIGEWEFQDHITGGLKHNVIPVMFGGQTAEKPVFEMAAKMGVKLVLHTSIEDVISRLTGQPRITLYKAVHAAAKESSVVDEAPTPTRVARREAEP